MEYGVDIVLTQHAFNVSRRRYVAMLECKVWSVVEYPRVIQGCTIIKFIERDDVIMGVCENQMAHKPACSTTVSVFGISCRRKSHSQRPSDVYYAVHIHEPRPSSDKYILRVM